MCVPAVQTAEDWCGWLDKYFCDNLLRFNADDLIYHGPINPTYRGPINPIYLPWSNQMRSPSMITGGMQPTTTRGTVVRPVVRTAALTTLSYVSLPRWPRMDRRSQRRSRGCAQHVGGVVQWGSRSCQQAVGCCVSAQAVSACLSRMATRSG